MKAGSILGLPWCSGSFLNWILFIKTSFHIFPLLRLIDHLFWPISPHQRIHKQWKVEWTQTGLSKPGYYRATYLFLGEILLREIKMVNAKWFSIYLLPRTQAEKGGKYIRKYYVWKPRKITVPKSLGSNLWWLGQNTKENVRTQGWKCKQILEKVFGSHSVASGSH